MDWESLGPDARKRVQEILGYLNFSSGATDPRFLGNLNELFGQLAASGPPPTWKALREAIQTSLDHLRGCSDAFRDVEQAQAVLRLVFEHVLPAYRQFHRDVLFHQTEESLFQPLLLGRVFEAVLGEGGPWEETDRIVAAAIARLDDFIGHRPVAILQTGQRMQPYSHEWVRPIPLYVRDAGVAVGRYREVVQNALDLLAATDPDLLQQAWFDLRRLDELAVDPRAYDFDHPVNRRPNYHFGGWDPHQIDNRGYYRRFVLQEVTLESLWQRTQDQTDLPPEETLFEAAAVLAGTMLMGSGITGAGPETHDSSVTLSTLVTHIAGYRDLFYDRLLALTGGERGKRLRAEAKALRQPFAGARQHLNQALARRRAEQLQHVHLARLYARMGFTEAATEQAHIVPVASARMRCQIDCRVTAAHLAIDRKDLGRAAAILPEIEDLLHRAIECGAMADPWNILGFGGQFSRFPAPEDSVHDERIDELIELVSELFGLFARLEGEAAAAGDETLRGRLSAGLESLARWWDQYASTEVSGVEGVSGRQAWESAEQVAKALGAWHRAGTAAGNLAFWREHAEQFRSAKTYALLVEALLEKRDLVAAMALLMHWLGQADEIPLAQGQHSFHALAMRWIETLWAPSEISAAPSEPKPRGRKGKAPPAPAAAPAVAPSADPRWQLTRKFFDHLEANADEYWQVPHLDLAGLGAGGHGEDEEEPAEDADGDRLFSAAYENVIYRDTTDDGFEGEMLEWGPTPTDFELSHEAERISRRLVFLATVARLWRFVALASRGSATATPGRDEALAGWLAHAVARERQLDDLLSAAHRYRVPPPRGSHESLVEYDHRQAIKEALLERIVAACAETVDAARLIRATMDRDEPIADREGWEGPVHQVLRAVFRGDLDAVRREWPQLIDQLARQPLLYLPLYRGGNPQRIVQSRIVQQVLRRLLTYLPRLGLLEETSSLLGTVQAMERDHPAGAGAITEYDQLFELACRGMVQCVVASMADWQAGRTAARLAARSPGRRADRALSEMVERVIELLLQRWLAHNRAVRLSVLENVAGEGPWKGLQKFIERYGHDLFTQRFLMYGNLRAILHQGVEAYLGALEKDDDAEERFQLLDDLGGPISREDAARWLEVAIEAVVENYAEYRDYNTTTTQSDRGEMLFILLDFLRLKASYDRVAWNLRPVVTAHQVLLQSGRSDAAAAWREQIAQRSKAVAEDLLGRFEKLRTRYGIRLRSIVDRLDERFVKPLAIDRLRSWVRPAMEELRGGQPAGSFEQLRRDVAQFTAEPEGVGLDVPPWLEALEDEVHRVRTGAGEDEDRGALISGIPQVRLTLAEIRRQLESWEEK